MKKGAVLLVIAIALGPGCARQDASQAESRIFFFSPPSDFNNQEQYFADHHYVASFGSLGPEREGIIRFDHPSLNFSQSAWDPESRSLFTWKKNYRGKDHLMMVKVPSMEVEAVSRFPESGGSPLLAFDTRRRRVLVAPKYGFGLEALRGSALERELYLVEDELLIVRYVDLGRKSPHDTYEWSYELYAIDASTGSSRFVRSFR
ncbi:MAG: hypothetical protein ABR517_02510 [Thermoanaerobaculia bacterium]